MIRCLIILWIYLKYANATLCEIEGVERNDWYYGKKLQQKIPDSQEGPFMQFKTKNIIGIEEQMSIYFNASFANDVLQLHTNSKFKSFEEEYEEDDSTLLEIAITLKCVQNTIESIRFLVRVEDVNDNLPIFDRDVYEYEFGTTVPEDYCLTDILPISVSDKDFSNARMYFSVDYNTIVRVQYHGKRKNYDDNYFATVQTLKEIQPPFRENFTIIATDSGSPPRKSTAIVSLTVSTNALTTYYNQGIFSKSAYIAKYLNNYVDVEEPIKLRCPNKIHLQQKGFENNFKIEVRTDGIVEVINLQPLSDKITSSQSFILIDLKADCDNVSERSTLIISLTEDPPEKGVVNLLYSSNTNLGSLIVYASAISAVIIIKIKVLYMYFQKHHKRFNMSLPL